MLSYEPTLRFFGTRCGGLLLCLWIYSICFGGGISNNPTAATAPVSVITEAEKTAGADSSLIRVADGQHDATAVLQALCMLKDGEVRPATSIMLPPGTYRITEPIVVDLKQTGPFALHGNGVARIVMEGAGPAFHVIGTHEGTAAPHTLKDEVWDRQRTPLVDGIEIIGKHAEASGIELTGTMQPTLTRITVRHCLHAIHLTKRNRNVQISDCHLYDNSGVGVYMDGVNLHQINIVGCHISYNAWGGIVCRACEVRNLQIGTCDIEGNMIDSHDKTPPVVSPDLPPAANILLDCREGSVREGAIVGCTIQHNHTANESANIRFVGQSDENRLKVGNFTISHNALSDVRVNIDLRYARGVTITGNTIWKGFDDNIRLEGCDDIVIGPNLFDRNPDYNGETSANTLRLTDCHNCSLSGLHIHGSKNEKAALLLTGCENVSIHNAMLLDIGGSGIQLIDCTRCLVTDCTISDSGSTAIQTDELETTNTAINIVGGTDNIERDNTTHSFTVTTQE